MISEDRADELLEVLLEDKELIDRLSSSTKNINKVKCGVRYNAELIFKYSNLADIENEDILTLVLDLMLSVKGAEQVHRIPIDKAELISKCPELNTGRVFALPNSSVFDAVIKEYVEDKIALLENSEKTESFDKLIEKVKDRVKQGEIDEVDVKRTFYDYMVNYIYDSLPSSIKTEDKEQSVKSMFEMTK